MNKNCIIVICDEVRMSMRKSYNDMYTNKTVIQRNKVLSFHFGSVYYFSECSPFTFGEMCTKTCNCLDVNERCETRDGSCTSGCISGFTGDDCHTGN